MLRRLILLRPLAWFLAAAVATILCDQLVKEFASRRLATSGATGPPHTLVVQTPTEGWVSTSDAVRSSFTFMNEEQASRVARHHVRILGGKKPDANEMLPPGTHLEILNRDIVLIPGWLKLEYLENRRASFALPTLEAGLTPEEVGMLGVLIAVACLYFLYMAPRDEPEFSVGLGLIAGGTLANAMDRLFRGAVIDYVAMVDFPTFNLADVAIVVGAGLLAFQMILWIVWEYWSPARARELVRKSFATLRNRR